MASDNNEASGSVETLETVIQKVVQQSKNESLTVSGKEGTPETIDTPKYVREFGLSLEKYVKGLNVDEFLKKVDAEIKPDTRTKLQKMLLELEKEVIQLKQDEKDEATRAVSVTAKKMTPAEITAEAKKRVDDVTPAQFVSRLISKVVEGDDRMIHTYFSNTLKMLEEVIASTTSSLSLKDMDSVKRLVKFKTIMEAVSQGSSPFYKTPWFIATIVLFSLMLVGVAIFLFFTIRKGSKPTIPK